MLESNLIETLLLLRPNELTLFDKFIASPFFNDGPYARDILLFWQYLYKYAPEFNHPDLSVEHAYASIFTGKPLVKGRIEVLMSKLHQLLKQFASENTKMLFEIPEPLKLAAFYVDRGLYKRAEPLLAKTKIQLDKTEIHDLSYWATLFLMEWTHHRLDTAIQSNHDHDYLSSSLLSLQRGYLLLMLESINNILFTSRKSKIDTALAWQIAEGIPQAVAVAGIEQEPMLLLLFKGFEMVRNPLSFDQTQLRQLLNTLDGGGLTPDVVRTIHTYLRNHCTWQFNQGDISYAPLLHELLKSAFGKGYLFDQGQIQASTLLNIVQSGLLNKEFEWVKHVLEQCSGRILGVPDPERFHQYNMANYYYHVGDNDTALLLLQDSTDNLFSGLMARKLEIKIYFETQSALLFSKMDNFKVYIFRNGKKHFSENIYMMNNNFIDILRQLASPGGMNGRNADKIAQKIAQTPLLAERSWLLAQLAKTN